MQAPDAIKRLVDTFDRNIFDYKNSAYKEAHVRQEFINPFWHELGWDMNNSAGLPSKLREVTHEDSVEIDGNRKSPDYGFRKGEHLKFYLEAKAPRIYLKEDISPAFQIKSYAWSGGLPVSVLSDFEEFAVYQCTNRPKAEDKTIKDRIAYFKYTEYVEKWDWLYERFSKEAVFDGRFDTFANTYAKKRGTQSFDKAFLADMHEWRTKLAQNIALRNPWIDERELNYAVQATLDRIIFLRIAEDRGIEKYGNLGVEAGLDYVLEAKSTKRRKVEGVYKALLKRFKLADDRYNSGLFHFSKEKERGAHDTITPKLEIDDKVITKIVEQLYYPESPYAFDQVPADVLGSVYEQFLGQVITLSPSHKASIDYKPEVKKAGGVYYTPKYIVDYIVKNTLGKLLDDIWQPEASRAGTPDPRDTSRVGRASLPDNGGDNTKPLDLTKLHKKASALTILDPACGSGSFLLGAYQYLLDWYHNFYTQTDPKHWVKSKAIEAIPSSSPTQHSALSTQDFRLTTTERKRILLAHIHGVDIDSQAVEVAKLNLLLKASEGGSAQAQGQFTYDKNERLLPDLEKNIVCGNSLVEWDYILKNLSAEEKLRVNALDFTQAFPEAVSREGFDCIIGNPPWGAYVEDAAKGYLTAKYPSVADYESSQYFGIRSIQLINERGIVGLIVPNTLALNVYAKRFRDSLLNEGTLREVVDYSDIDVFGGPHVRSLIAILDRQSDVPTEFYKASQPSIHKHLRSIPKNEVASADSWKKFFDEESPLTQLLDRIVKQCGVLSDLADVRQGYIPYRTSTLERRHGAVKAGKIVKERAWHSEKKLDSTYKKELQGADVNRYSVKWSGTWVKYGEWVSTYLPMTIFSGPRVLIREITSKPPYILQAAYTEDVYIHNPSILAVLLKDRNLDPLYLVGLLNSKLVSAAFLYLAPKAKKGLFPKIIITDARLIPVPKADATDKQKNVRRICELVKRRMATENPRQGFAVDAEIDRLVYELYELSEEEVRIIEE